MSMLNTFTTTKDNVSFNGTLFKMDNCGFAKIKYSFQRNHNDVSLKHANNALAIGQQYI